MGLKKLFDLKGINIWYLGSAIALNLFWTLLIALAISMLFLKQIKSDAALVQIFLLLATFIGPMLIGWMIGSLAGDSRGPTYGIVGSIGSLIVLVFTALPSGLIGGMLIFAAVAGGLNGGLFSLQRR